MLSDTSHFYFLAFICILSFTFLSFLHASVHSTVMCNTLLPGVALLTTCLPKRFHIVCWYYVPYVQYACVLCTIWLLNGLVMRSCMLGLISTVCTLESNSILMCTVCLYTVTDYNKLSLTLRLRTTLQRAKIFTNAVLDRYKLQEGLKTMLSAVTISDTRMLHTVRAKPLMLRWIFN